MEQEIENIVFSRFVKQAIPFEFISIQELFDRCDQSGYDLTNPHRIEFHALLVIVEGESSHMVDFKEYQLSPGIILPLTKGQVHSFQKTSKINGFIISFDEGFITQHSSEKNLFHFLQVFHSTTIDIGKANLKHLHPFTKLLENVHKEDLIELKAEIINALFMSFLLQIKRLDQQKTEAFDSRKFKHFLDFKSLVTQHYHQNHSAEYYATQLGISYKYLNTICKEIDNKTAKAFIDSWLLLEIKRNIAEERYTSQEIAYKMGFQEPSNFIRFFKKHTGSTPTKFKNL